MQKYKRNKIIKLKSELSCGLGHSLQDVHGTAQKIVQADYQPCRRQDKTTQLKILCRPSTAMRRYRRYYTLKIILFSVIGK